MIWRTFGVYKFEYIKMLKLVDPSAFHEVKSECGDPLASPADAPQDKESQPHLLRDPYVIARRASPPSPDGLVFV